MEPTRAFTIDVVSTLTGLSEGILRRWDSRGLVVPAFANPDRRRRHSRIYSFEDLVALRILALLRDRGVSSRHLPALAPLVKTLAATPSDSPAFFVAGGQVFADREGAITSDEQAIEISPRAVADEMMERIRRREERTPDEIGRITRHRYVMSGVPVLAGTRIPTTTITSFIEHGYSPAEIIAEFPRLTEADVAAAIAYEAARRAGREQLLATG